jgi:DNA-binding helix-turn-helix protein
MRLLDGHMDQIINKLEAHESKTLSRWRETAEYRQTNKLWLRHSQRIAVIRK